MFNKNQGWLWLALWLLPVCIACQKQPAREVLVEHEKQYPDLRKKYIYQSVIRIANVKKDPDFEKLIKDLNKIIVYLPPDGDSTYQVTPLRSAFRSAGYEELVDVRTKDAQRISLWLSEKGDAPHYVALLDSEDTDLILEMDGEIHPEYLSAITSADESQLMDLLKTGF